MFPCAQNSQGVALLCSIKVQIPAQEGEEEREACQEERRCHVSGLISVVSLPPSLPPVVRGCWDTDANKAHPRPRRAPQ